MEITVLISFTVKNWRSFRDEAEFSMVVCGERQHGDRVARVKRYGLGILPVAVKSRKKCLLLLAGMHGLCQKNLKSTVKNLQRSLWYASR